MADPEQVVGDWMNGEFGSEALPRFLPLTHQQAERMRRAAERAALTAYSRIMADRRRRLQALQLFADTTEELTAEVLRGWLDGKVTGPNAAELIGTTPFMLEALARRHGLI